MNETTEKKAKRVKRTIKSSNAVIEITLDEAFEDFIKEKEFQNKAQSTIRNYKQSYNYFREYHDFDETTLVKDVEKPMVYEFIGFKRSENISEASVNHYLRDIRTFLYWCMDEPREYLKPFKIKEGTSQELKPKIVNEDEIERLLIKPTGRRDGDFVEWRSYAIVCWILGTGNRAGTIVDVRLGDLDYNKKEITLSHTKNKKAQGIPFSDSLKSVIKEYVKLYRSEAENEDYLFSNIGNEKLTYNALRLAHTRYCQDREVENKSLHSLRHTFAYNYMKSGGDVMRLQKILGHSNLTVTRRYVNLMIEDLKYEYEDHSMLDIMKKKAKRTKLVKSSS